MDVPHGTLSSTYRATAAASTVTVKAAASAGTLRLEEGAREHRNGQSCET